MAAAAEQPIAHNVFRIENITFIIIAVGIWIFKFFFIGLSPFFLLLIKKLTEIKSRIRAMTLPLEMLNTTLSGKI